jgi:2-methylcitrate dehydratase PrpD
VVPRDDFTRGQAIVEIVTRHGQTHARHTRAVRGTIANPMTWEEVVEKARSLMDPVLGKRKARGIVNAVSKLETLDDVTRLRPLLAVRSSRPVT